MACGRFLFLIIIHTLHPIFALLFLLFEGSAHHIRYFVSTLTIMVPFLQLLDTVHYPSISGSYRNLLCTYTSYHKACFHCTYGGNQLIGKTNVALRQKTEV